MGFVSLDCNPLLTRHICAKAAEVSRIASFAFRRHSGIRRWSKPLRQTNHPAEQDQDQQTVFIDSAIVSFRALR